MSEDLVEVHLLGLPLDVWARSREQHDALMREFTLMTLPSEDDDRARHLPSRLIDLIARLNVDYAGATSDQEEQLYAARDAGRATLDVSYQVPPGAAVASRELGALLDEADEYCRQGQHLLTLAADEELVRFRWWYLDQFIDQLAGRPPVAWADYRRTAPV